MISSAMFTAVPALWPLKYAICKLAGKAGFRPFQEAAPREACRSFHLLAHAHAACYFCVLLCAFSACY